MHGGGTGHPQSNQSAWSIEKQAATDRSTLQRHSPHSRNIRHSDCIDSALYFRPVTRRLCSSSVIMALLHRATLLLLALLAILVLTHAIAPPPVYEHKVRTCTNDRDSRKLDYDVDPGQCTHAIRSCAITFGYVCFVSDSVNNV